MPKQTVNARLSDLLAQHAHYLLAVEAGLALLVTRSLSAAMREAAALVVAAQIDPTAAAAYGAYRLLMLAIAPRMEDAVFGVYTSLRAELLTLAVAEDRALIGILNSVLPAPVAVALDSTPITLNSANALVGMPIAGNTMSGRLNGLLEEANRNVADAILTSATLGEGTAQITDRLHKYVQGGVARLLLLTAQAEAQRVSVAAQRGVYDSNRNLLYGVQYTATLDRRTCPVCYGYNGNFYAYTSGESPPDIPQHPHCRCRLDPVLKSWQDLGFKPTDIEGFTSLASLTGENARPEDYATWFERQPAGVQTKILGKVRYAAWTAGKMKTPTSARAAVPSGVTPIPTHELGYLLGM